MNNRPYGTFLGNLTGSTNVYKKVGNITFNSHQQGKTVWLRILLGIGNNSLDTQQAYIDLVGQLAWTGASGGRAGWNAVFNAMKTSKTISVAAPTIIANSNTDYDIYIKATTAFTAITPVYIPILNNDLTTDTVWTPDFTSGWSSTAPTGTACTVGVQNIIPTS